MLRDFMHVDRWGPDTYHFGLGWYDGAAEIHLGNRILRFSPDPAPREMKAQGRARMPRGWWLLPLAVAGVLAWAQILRWVS